MTHGTYSGWNRHKRAGEEPCGPCREAQRAYYAAWWERVGRPRYQAGRDRITLEQAVDRYWERRMMS